MGWGWFQLIPLRRCDQPIKQGKYGNEPAISSEWGYHQWRPYGKKNSLGSAKYVYIYTHRHGLSDSCAPKKHINTFKAISTQSRNFVTQNGFIPAIWPMQWPVLPLVNTCPSRLCRWWGPKGSHKSHADCVTNKCRMLARSQAVQFWPWLGGDSFPFQHLAERFLFSLCQRPCHASGVWRNPSGKNAHRYSHRYSHHVYSCLFHIFPTSMASMAIDLYGCHLLDYWLFLINANEAISWNGTEGRCSVLLRLFLLFSILVGHCGTNVFSNVLFVLSESRLSRVPHSSLASYHRISSPVKMAFQKGVHPYSPVVQAMFFLQLRDVQSQMRRCEQQPEDFEDVDALWGCAPELLWVDGWHAMAAGLSSQPFYWEQEDYDSSILIIKSRDKLWTKHDKAIWIAAIPVRSLTAWNEYVFFCHGLWASQYHVTVRWVSKEAKVGCFLWSSHLGLPVWSSWFGDIFPRKKHHSGGITAPPGAVVP